MSNRVWVAAGASVVVGALCVNAGGKSVVQAKESVTFTEDVAPIVFSKCATCHRPGEAAPFSLMTYDDVKRRGPLLPEGVTSHARPAGKAVAGDCLAQKEPPPSDTARHTITHRT